MDIELRIIAISHDRRKLYTQEGMILEFAYPLKMNEFLEKLPECEPEPYKESEETE